MSDLTEAEAERRLRERDDVFRILAYVCHQAGGEIRISTHTLMAKPHDYRLQVIDDPYTGDLLIRRVR